MNELNNSLRVLWTIYGFIKREDRQENDVAGFFKYLEKLIIDDIELKGGKK